MKISKQELAALQCVYEGANSVIYRQDTNEYGAPVIIKLSKHAYPTPRQIVQFATEYALTRDLDLPGIRKAYDTGMIDDRPALILDYVEGETIGQAFVAQRKNLAEVLTMAIAIAQALGEIHRHNIIHKNINSRHILVNLEQQAATIIDFGIASQVDLKTRHLEIPEVLEGTLAYISPEQTGRMNRSVDYRTDLYSLGVVLYEMLTGRLPFDATDASELVHCHIARRPPSVCEVNSDIPEVVSDIVMKLMAKNAEDRYQSAFGLTADLENCLNQLEETGTVQGFELAREDFSERLEISQKLSGREQEINTLIQTFERERAQAALSREAEINLSADELSRKLLSPASIDDISSLVLEQAKRLTYSAFGFVGHIDPKTGYFIIPTLTRDIWDTCQVADKDIVFKKFTGLWGWVLENRKPLMTNAAVDDPRSSGIPPGHIPIHRFLSAPALIGETLVGQVAVANADGEYTERDLQVIERLANLYAIAIQRQRTELLNRTLFRITNAINTTANLDELYASIHDTLGAVIDTTNFYIALYDKATNSISFPYFEDEMDNDYAYIRDFTATNSLTGEVILSRAPLFLTQGMLLERAEKKQILGTVPKIWLGVPLTIKAEVIGVMAVQSYSDAERFEKADLAILNAVAGQIAIVIDRKRAEDELKKHRDHLEELVRERTAELVVAKDAAEEARRLAEAASQAKSTFLANMSHELRTPLNAILGYAQILQWRPLDADVINALNTVQRSGEHLLTLINDILDIARIEAGRLELFPTPIHFPGFLDHIASIIRSRADAKGLTFTFEKLAAIPVGVQADETRLRQVLLNLLDNAVKFTDEGQVTLRVKCEGVKREFTHHVSHITFQIQDTGIGIPSEQLEHIFQSFEQVGGLAHRTKGTGLGLAISRQLVKLMGGELQVESEPGRGSTFWFEVALSVMEVVREVTPSPRQIVTGYKGPRRTVLVVDDVPSNRAMLVDLLGPLEFDVVEAADGQQAIHLAQELRPDLILMDRWMPVLDGFEATRRIRQIPELEGVTIVTVSASVLAEDQAHSQEVGFDAFLPKPVNWPDLAALLEEWLGLEWEYEEEKEKGDGEEGETVLAPPPQEELAILLDLALRGNMQAIRERAAYIETLGEQYVPFARKLRELAKGFEERAILALVERYVEEEK